MAETNLITEAVQQSEQDLIEKQMLEDKIRATDWEATDEAIEQQIAQESYLEWLKQSEKRQNRDVSVKLKFSYFTHLSAIKECFHTIDST